MSRLRTLLVFAALLALATALAACGGSSTPSNNEDPHKVVDNATLKGIKSGNLNLAISVKAKGKEGGNLDLSLSGPFQSEEGKEKLPQLDLTAKANGSINGKAVNFEGGLTLLPSTAYVKYKGVSYEVDPTTFSYVKSALKQAQQKGGATGKAGSSACQEAASKLKFSEFMENLKNEGNADVGGTTTTKVSGDLNVPKAIEAFVKLAENPACSSQLGATGSLSQLGQLGKAKGQIEKAVKTAHIELYVGSDHIVRRGTVQLTIEPPKGSSGPESVELGLDLSLSGVNQKQTIEAPQGAKPLNELFLKLGINPIELLGKGGGAGGLGGLLKGLGGGSSSAGGGSATPAPSGAPSAEKQQAYMKCLQSAKTPADLQRCAALVK